MVFYRLSLSPSGDIPNTVKFYFQWYSSDISNTVITYHITTDIPNSTLDYMYVEKIMLDYQQITANKKKQIYEVLEKCGASWWASIA